MRHINEAGLDILKGFETLRLEAYDDGTGVITIGWGHTGKDVVLGQKITPERADELLIEDVKEAEEAVEQLVNVNISDNQFSALVVFVFNIGRGNFSGSTMLKMINLGEVVQAADEFDRWVRANGKVLGGLKLRRASEKELYLLA